MPDPAPSEGQEPGVSPPGSGSVNPVVVANSDQPVIHSSSASGPPPSPASPQPSAIHPQAPPAISDYELLLRIGGGSYGEVWMARTAVGTCHAVKIVYRKSFDHDRPYEREFSGVKKFEPISRSHPNLVAVLHVGRNDAAGYFYYVMELADEASGPDTRYPIPDTGLRRPTTDDRGPSSIQHPASIRQPTSPAPSAPTCALRAACRSRPVSNSAWP